jgi:hypothetical protein
MPSTVASKETKPTSLPERVNSDVEPVSEKNPVLELFTDLVSIIDLPSQRRERPKKRGGHQLSSESSAKHRRRPPLKGFRYLSSRQRNPARFPVIVPKAERVKRISTTQTTPRETKKTNTSLNETFDISDKIFNDLGDTEQTALNPARTEDKDVSTAQDELLMWEATEEDDGKDVEQISSSISAVTPEENDAMAQPATESTHLSLHEMFDATVRSIPLIIPEGHKLVHIMRHARAWHKYIRIIAN